jgi:V8-like Glu-specific endopeptidase
MAKSKIIKILLLVAVVLVGLLVTVYLGRNLAPENSSALFGGKLETGYEFAGYAISYDGNKITTCGVTFLNPSTVITAAHCVKEGADLYIGTGTFKPSRQENIAVNNYIVNSGWSGRPENDIAVFNLSTNVNLGTYATIGTAKEGCNYEIVGYGQNETSVPGDFSTKLRKSIQVCIENIVGNIAYMKGLDGGICYGDSGSPVFEKSTNRIVGIVSSIVSTSNDKSSYCAVSNIGALVLPKSYESFILSSQFGTASQGISKAVCGNNCVTQTDCSDGLTCLNNKCSLGGLTTSCVSQAQSFCSSAIGVSCGDGSNCIGNVCVATSELNQQQVSEVFEGINPVIIAILLAVVIFCIIVLLLIPTKKRY